MTHTVPGLELRSVRKSWPGLEAPVLDGVDLVLQPGEAVAVIGPSGSGKSTLLSIAAGLEPPDAGTALIAGEALAVLPAAEQAQRRARAIGIVFQDHHLLPQLSARENVLLPALAAGQTAARAARADELLAALAVGHRAAAFPAQLSGGERQRVAVARALLMEPALLLCDEPTGNLDPRSATAVIDLALELARRARSSVLLVTHQRDLAARCDRVLVLEAGRLRAG